MKTPEFFSKSQAPSLFNLDETLTLCKKSKIHTSDSKEKLQTNRQTNVRKVLHCTFTSWVQKSLEEVIYKHPTEKLF